VEHGHTGGIQRVCNVYCSNFECYRLLKPRSKNSLCLVKYYGTRKHLYIFYKTKSCRNTVTVKSTSLIAFYFLRNTSAGWLALWSRIREVSGSNFGHSDWSFSWFFAVPPVIYRNSIRPQPLHSNSFFINRPISERCTACAADSVIKWTTSNNNCPKYFNIVISSQVLFHNGSLLH
jgi:hypothetical protein